MTVQTCKDNLVTSDNPPVPALITDKADIGETVSKVPKTRLKMKARIVSGMMRHIEI